MKTYAYLKVSTDKQDLENQKFAILQYANKKKLGNV
jgi:DNA invertase Pin-like site-specific DNA recombinase